MSNASQTFLSSSLAPELSVVVPVRNEVDNILPLMAEISAVLTPICSFEVIYVDDGSMDGTAARLAEAQHEYPMLRVARHARSCGQSRAVATGVGLARASLIATLDGDGQNDPADLPAMLDRMRALAPKDRDALLLAGWRRERRDNWVRRLSSRLACWARGILLRDSTPDSGCGIKMFSRAAFLDMPYFDHMHRFLPALMRRRGGEVSSVPVHHRPRERGVSKYGVWNRLWVSLVDLRGMMWLQRRCSRAEVAVFEPKTDTSGR